MTRWTYGVLVVTLAGACGDSKEAKCTAQRKAAADAVVGALTGLEIDRDQKTRELEEARSTLSTLDDDDKTLESRIRLFEQSMDCLVYKDDCCKRLGKMKDRRSIWGIMHEIFKDEQPDEVTKVLAPLQALEVDAEDLQGASSKDAEKFCTASRAEVARVRQELPAAWTAARAVVKNDVDERKARVDVAQQRVKAIGEWADAIRKNQKATIAADLGDSDGSFGRARAAVEAYNTTCH